MSKKSINKEEIIEISSMTNEEMRELAHSKLDAILDEVDGEQGAFGNVGLDVPFQNGYFQRAETLIRQVYHATQVEDVT